jgi:hypothetical protein
MESDLGRDQHRRGEREEQGNGVEGGVEGDHRRLAEDDRLKA